MRNSELIPQLHHIPQSLLRIRETYASSLGETGVEQIVYTGVEGNIVKVGYPCACVYQCCAGYLVEWRNIRLSILVGIDGRILESIAQTFAVHWVVFLLPSGLRLL